MLGSWHAYISSSHHHGPSDLGTYLGIQLFRPYSSTKLLVLYCVNCR